MPKRVKKPKSKTRKIVEGILTGIIIALLGFVGLSLITGMVYKKHTVSMMFNKIGTAYVLTDSMVPVYPVNSTIIIENITATELIKHIDANEEVDVTFFNALTNDPARPSGKTNMVVTNQVMTHRIISYYVNEAAEEGKGRYYFYAEGINTQSDTGKESQYQVFTEDLIIGRVIAKSQFLGLMTQFITSVWGLLILLLIPSFYMIITSVLEIFKAYKTEDEVPEVANDNVVATVDGKESEIKKDVLENISEKDKERLKK